VIILNKLTYRQQKIVEIVPKVATAMDVGCDHGLVGASLLESGVAEKVIFSDISRPSLDKAKRLILDLGLGNAEFICQDGLRDAQCDCAIIAGMGGKEMVKILSDAVALPQFLVLQPMKNVVEVREYLCSQYYIERDYVFRDKKFYNLILARRGSDSLDELQLELGKTNMSEPSADFAAYVHLEIIKCITILSRGGGAGVSERLTLLERAAAVIKGE
jgi:tRNA A22 N-methylase